MKPEDVKQIWACKSVDDGELMHFSDSLTPQLFVCKFDAEVAASDALNNDGEDHEPVKLCDVSNSRCMKPLDTMTAFSEWAAVELLGKYDVTDAEILTGDRATLRRAYDAAREIESDPWAIGRIDQAYEILSNSPTHFADKGKS